MIWFTLFLLPFFFYALNASFAVAGAPFAVTLLSIAKLRAALRSR